MRLTWLEHCPVTKRLQVRFLMEVPMIPSPGAYWRLPINASLLHQRFSLSLPLSLKAMKKKCPQVRVKKKSDTCNMNVENIVLSDINQTENDNYCMIPFM